MSDHNCDACPVPGADCLLRRRGQCHHAARERIVRARRPGAETPYTDRAIAHADRADPFAAVDTGGRLRVGFLGGGLAVVGGVETWHDTLLPRLDHGRIAAIGYGVVAGGYFDDWQASRIARHCPVVSGLDDCRALARASDVLVCWGVPSYAPYLTPRGSRDRPAIVSVSHGDGNSPWAHWIFRDSDADTDHYVAVSEAARGPIPEARRDSAAVIPNAVDPGRLVVTRGRAEVRAEFGITLGAPLVLYCGRLADEKRPDLAAAALANLPGAYLLIAGDGYWKDPVVEAAKASGARVIFAGARPDVADLMAAADMLVSPSDCEGFGLAMAEALWLGCPVVATPTGLLADRPDLARIVPRGATASDWAEAIRSELADPEKARIRSRAASSEARRLFAPDRFAGDWSAFLLGMAEPPPPTPRVVQRQSPDAELLANAEACPHRVPMPEDRKTGCSCRYLCEAGKGPRHRKGGATLQDCWKCPIAPRLAQSSG